MTTTESSESNKTFLLGLGNQKCATSWLHKYLSQNTNFDGGFAKEYHIWDALDIPLVSSQLYQLLTIKLAFSRYYPVAIG